MKSRLAAFPVWGWMVVLLAVIAIVDMLIPPEHTLGKGIRLIYLHGAWVWTGIILYVLAAISGLVAIFTHQAPHHQISAALGRAALIFWLTYLPMSLLVMKLNWNGFFFAEPRWSVPFSLAVASLLVQAGVFFINQPVLTSLANLGFGAILVYNLATIQSILHPQSAIQQSGSWVIQALFLALVILILAMGCLTALILYRLKNRPVRKVNR